MIGIDRQKMRYLLNICSSCAGRCLDRTICEEGSESEPWTVSYNVLNAHAAAVASFRRILPDGKISLNINPTWSEPFTSSPEDAVNHLKSQQGFYSL